MLTPTERIPCPTCTSEIYCEMNGCKNPAGLVVIESKALIALRDLLARIHADGGHYVAQHGLNKAVEDADALVASWRAQRVAPISLHPDDANLSDAQLAWKARTLLAEALQPAPAPQEAMEWAEHRKQRHAAIEAMDADTRGSALVNGGAA